MFQIIKVKYLIFIVIIAAVVPALVNSKPQRSIGGAPPPNLNLGGPAPVVAPPAPPALSLTNKNPSIQVQLTPQKVSNSATEELKAVIKLQFYVQPSNSEDLIKLHEANTTFTIPATLNRKCQEGDQLYHEPTGKCYLKGPPIEGTPSPCLDEFHEFAESYEKPGLGYGECYCAYSVGSQPVVLWGKSNRCYPLYDQGPCKEREWLVHSSIADPDGYRDVICEKRPCPDNVLDPYNSFQKFWFQHKGKCYLTETPSKELCGENKDLQVYLSLDSQEPVCLKMRPIIPVRSFASGAGDLECRAGHKKQPNGNCKRVARFE